MKIVKGQLFINKTVKYLYPALSAYGSEFESRFRFLGILSIGIHDKALTGTPYEPIRKICILVDKTVNKNHFLKVCDWLRSQPYFLVHYSYGSLTSDYAIIVIRFPEQYDHAFDMFVDGKYSEMYKQDEIDKLFPDQEPKNPVMQIRQFAKQVITKRVEAKKRFAEALNQAYNTDVSYSDIEGEFDFPPNKQEEFFNFKY